MERKEIVLAVIQDYLKFYQRYFELSDPKKALEKTYSGDCGISTFCITYALDKLCHIKAKLFDNDYHSWFSVDGVEYDTRSGSVNHVLVFDRFVTPENKRITPCQMDYVSLLINYLSPTDRIGISLITTYLYRMGIEVCEREITLMLEGGAIKQIFSHIKTDNYPFWRMLADDKTNNLELVLKNEDSLTISHIDELLVYDKIFIKDAAKIIVGCTSNPLVLTKRDKIYTRDVYLSSPADYIKFIRKHHAGGDSGRLILLTGVKLIVRRKNSRSQG